MLGWCVFIFYFAAAFASTGEGVMATSYDKGHSSLALTSNN